MIGDWIRGPINTQYQASQQRYARYQRYMAAYQGLAYREIGSLGRSAEAKRIKHNLARPICNISAGWLAGDHVKWVVHSEDDKTRERLSRQAEDIWDRSGSDANFLQAALAGTIYGEIAGIARLSSPGKARIDFVDPCICEPVFSDSNIDDLTSLIIEYRKSNREQYREVWTKNDLTVTDGKVETVTEYSLPDIPAVWIRNQSMKGILWGISDLDGVIEALMEYEHICAKQTRIVDYYSAPTIIIEGATAKDLTKDMKSVWFLKDGAKASFLEWQGNTPAVDKDLERLRRTISEVSETPQIALGHMEMGFSHSTGIAMKVLYGPLEGKTIRKRASWGPALERLMWLALAIEGETVNVEDVDIVWQDPVPQSTQENLQNALLKQKIGVPNEQLQKEAGYDDAEMSRMKAAMDAQMAIAEPQTPAQGELGVRMPPDPSNILKGQQG